MIDEQRVILSEPRWPEQAYPFDVGLTDEIIDGINAHGELALT